MWSEGGRPPPSELTDDTSVDAGPSRGSPALEGSRRGEQGLLEFGEPSAQVEDLKAEKEHIERQLRLAHIQLKRAKQNMSRGEKDSEGLDFEPVMYSAKQLRLIRKTLDNWRAHRAFSMAEVVLSSAVLVKEANIIRCVVITARTIFV